jgi:integrase
MQDQERVVAGDSWHDQGFVFCRPDGRPIDPRDDWDEWADILKAAGLAHRGVHAARHTAATLLLDQGVALAVVQEMLGHSDIRITRGYTHVSSPLTVEAARRMGSVHGLTSQLQPRLQLRKTAAVPHVRERPGHKRSRLSESNR